MTKVESNTHAAANYDPALGKSIFILDILKDILPKTSEVKKVANPIKSFVTLPGQVSTQERSLPNGKFTNRSKVTKV